MYEIYDRIFVCTQSTPISVRLPDPAVPLPPPFNVQEHEVRKQFNQQSCRKAAGPDKVSTYTLKHCDEKLAPVFMDLFSASLHQHCDYCPVALTSVVVNVLERLTVLTHMKSVTNSNVDPLQFAYRDNRYTDDAGALALHFVM